MPAQSIGKNLAYQRKLKGFTQNKLSEESQVTVRTIQRIEKGEVSPQLQTIKLLANALEIEVKDLQILENPKEETLQKKWLLAIHGSPMLGFIFPFSALFPLFLWLHKREDNPVYDLHGVKVINGEEYIEAEAMAKFLLYSVFHVVFYLICIDEFSILGSALKLII